MGLTSKDGLLIDFNALRAEVEKLLPGKELENPKDVIRFRPQPKQSDLLRACGVLDWFEGTGEKKPAVADFIGYGGAAYGAKTYGLMGLNQILAYAYPGIKIALFRRIYKEFEGAGSPIQYARELYTGTAKERDGGLEWNFGNTGSSLYMHHCEHEKDAYIYQGKSFDVLEFDEATHFPWIIVDTLKTWNRLGSECGLKKPFCIMTSNPGNVGHGWYMQLFNLERFEKWIRGEWSTPQKFLNPNNKYSEVFFIPSFISDNKIGTDRDPEYESRLRERDPDLAEAMIKGDWRVFSGMAFRQWDPNVHVINQKDLPADFKTYPKWRAVDWGYDAPFCCLWGAHDPATGRVFVYREVYAAGLTDSQQALEIVTNSPPEEGANITYGDPISFSIKHSRQGLIYTSADEYRENGVMIWNADNDRINGKKKIDQRLATIQDGKPGLIITDNCINLVRTLPKLARSQKNPEDVDPHQETHPYDTLRYLLTNVGMHSKKQGERTQTTEYNPYLKIKGI